MTPFWIFPIPNGAFIERHTPALPLSRDTRHLAALRRSLAIYRMVFGQPRQDDLIEHLRHTVPEADLQRHGAELRIDLEPPA